MINNIVYYHTAPGMIVKHCEKLSSPPPDYVTIKLLYCGICGGDYSSYLGRRKKYPISLGHELVGKIVSIGDNVQELFINDYVITDFNYRCNECKYCLENKTHLCIKNDIGLFSNRGFASYANIHKKYLYTINNLNNIKRACLIEPLSCVIHAINNFSIEKISPILICGVGSIGMLACFYLNRILKYSEIYIKETNPIRLQNIISHFSVNELTIDEQESFTSVIECTNSIQGLSSALDLVTKGGNICIMSHLYGLDTSLVYETICKKEIIPIFPLRNGNPNNIIEANKLIQKFWTEYDDEMIETFDDINIAFKNKDINDKNKQIISFV